MFYEMTYWILWLSISHILYMNGENLCTNELLLAINISTELQADVLLPCNFNPSLLGSDKSADVAVVWSQKNTTSHSLVEINLQGDVKFWNNKGGRIMTFPKLSESGNFSIVLQRVRPYDVGLYCCQLFNGTTCITYQELHLNKWTGPNLPIWVFIGGGGAGVLTLLVVLIYFIKRARSNAPNEHIYANSRFDKRNEKSCSAEKHSGGLHEAKAGNIVHVNKSQNPHNIYANGCTESGEIYVNQLR